MVIKEHVLHLRRHLAAREPLFVGTEIPVQETDDTAFVGNGIHPDKKAHLQGGECVKAEEIGGILYFPEEVGSVLIAVSPLARTVETATHNFVGMARSYAQNFLGIGLDNLSGKDKDKLSKQGLHKLANFEHFKGLAESEYCNSEGHPDDGNELVAEAYHKSVNPDFPGYKWIVQKGFENDARSEHPQEVAERALKELIPALLKYDLILAVTHQPNLEIITAALTGDLGRDANELWDRAGGGYELGGGFELRIYVENGQINDAQLKRTLEDSMKLEKELEVNINILKKYDV